MNSKENMQLSYAPAEISFSYAGETQNAVREMQSILKQQICLLCYNECKTVEELSYILQCNKAYITDAIKSLCNFGMMKKVGDVYESFITCFPLMHDNIETKARKIVYDYIIQNEIPKKIYDLIKNLENEIKKIDFYGNNLELEYLNWCLYKLFSIALKNKIRSFYKDKTDEIIINKITGQTQKRIFSIKGSYHYADEKLDEICMEQNCENYSSAYIRVQNYYVINLMDAQPFPYAWKDGVFNENGGRNEYITKENIDVYMKLIETPDAEFIQNPSENTKKIFEEFEKHGIVEKKGNSYVGLVPVFSNESYEQLENLIAKELTEIAKEIIENCGSKLEELFLPTMKGIKDRIDQFYIFWLNYFLDPYGELLWYGMNKEGLKIPKDYNCSAAGIYILKN